jgi:hypothetical protein
MRSSIASVQNRQHTKAYIHVVLVIGDRSILLGALHLNFVTYRKYEVSWRISWRYELCTYLNGFVRSLHDQHLRKTCLICSYLEYLVNVVVVKGLFERLLLNKRTENRDIDGRIDITWVTYAADGIYPMSKKELLMKQQSSHNPYL